MPDLFQSQRQEELTAMLRLITDHTPVMLAYFEAGTQRCLLANARFAAHYGLQPQQLQGQTVGDLAAVLDAGLGGGLGGRLSGECGQGPLVEQLQALLAPAQGGTPQPVHFTLLAQSAPSPARSSHYLETALLPHVTDGVLHGVMLQISDVCHRQQGHQQLRAQEERMRKFSAVTSEAIVLHRDGLILDGNEALERMTGYRLDELRGTPILDYVAPQFRLQALQYMRGEREDSYQSALVCKCGKLLPVETEAKSMPGASEDYRFVLLRDMTANVQARQRMDYLAQHDLLTRLPNREHLKQLLEQALEQARAQSGRVAVLSLDLEQLKAVNDSLSHRAGDLLLCEVAQRLRQALRPQDVVARIGSDDFVVLFTGNPSLLEAEALANQLREQLQAPYQIENTQLVVSLSMGIAMFPKDGNSCEELLSNAEAAMYMTKNLGRGLVQFYTPALEGRATRMLMQEQLLRQAVEQGGLELHYQPQIHLCSGELAGLEALVRWRHPHRGLLLPDEFIALAENRGLIAAIDRWVLHEACRQAVAWQQAGLPAVPIAVNLSAQEFRQHDVTHEVQQALARSGLQAQLLHLELTESTLMQSGSQGPDALHALKALGVSLAIDDFGTGYSSLASLRKHPIDRLKIDRSFICDLPHNPDALAIVTAIVQMGRSLHLEILAEGVESQAQRELLQHIGCDMMQGFLASAPLSAVQAQHWMSQHCHSSRKQ